MNATESQARQEMADASNKLEAALTTYTAARAKLAGITGELHAVDNKLSLTFKAKDGKAQGATITLTDC